MKTAGAPSRAVHSDGEVVEEKEDAEEHVAEPTTSNLEGDGDDGVEGDPKKTSGARTAVHSDGVVVEENEDAEENVAEEGDGDDSDEGDLKKTSGGRTAVHSNGEVVEDNEDAEEYVPERTISNIEDDEDDADAENASKAERAQADDISDDGEELVPPPKSWADCRSWKDVKGLDPGDVRELRVSGERYQCTAIHEQSRARFDNCEGSISKQD